MISQGSSLNESSFFNRIPYPIQIGMISSGTSLFTIGYDYCFSLSSNAIDQNQQGGYSIWQACMPSFAAKSTPLSILHQSSYYLGYQASFFIADLLTLSGQTTFMSSISILSSSQIKLSTLWLGVSYILLKSSSIFTSFIGQSSPLCQNQFKKTSSSIEELLFYCDFYKTVPFFLSCDNNPLYMFIYKAFTFCFQLSEGFCFDNLMVLQGEIIELPDLFSKEFSQNLRSLLCDSSLILLVLDGLSSILLWWLMQCLQQASHLIFLVGFLSYFRRLDSNLNSTQTFYAQTCFSKRDIIDIFIKVPLSDYYLQRFSHFSQKQKQSEVSQARKGRFQAILVPIELFNEGILRVS